MSTEVRFESTRRRLNDNQAATVDRIVAAVVEELREKGVGRTSVRSTASRAGVAPATAYTYFSSKGHLVVEVFWRRLNELGPIGTDLTTPGDRVVAVLRGVAMLVADEPELASAVTAALLGEDPEVEQLRLRIGLEIRKRVEAALGDAADEQTVVALELIYSGALLRAGMGYSSYEDMADTIESAARKFLGGSV